SDLLEEHARRRERRLRDLDLADTSAAVLREDAPHPLAETIDEVHDVGHQVADPELIPGKLLVELVRLRRDVDDEKDDGADEQEDQEQNRDDPRDAGALEKRDERPHRASEKECE